MKRLLMRGTVLGMILWTVGAMPAAWADATINIDRAGGLEGKGRIPINVEVSGPSGLAWVEIRILSPSYVPSSARPLITPFREPPAENGDAPCCSFGTSTNPYVQPFVWDTTDPTGNDTYTPYNGTYTFRVMAKEQFRGSPNCDPTSRYNCRDITVKVNNPPSTPQWVDVTGSKVDGRPVATISWRYTGSEPDLREFQIQRGGPDGTSIAAISASSPGGGCSVSGSTYKCTDNVFPSSGYAGSYSYKVTALRSSTFGPSSCKLAGGGFSAGSSCIGAGTASSQSVSFTEPASTGGSGSGGSGGGGGSGGSKTDPGSGGIRPAPIGTVIVGGTRDERPRLPGEGDPSEFYTGEYNPTLPYQNKYLLIPDRAKGGKRGNRLEAIGPGAGPQTPLGIPFKDRSVLVPIAGGLLLFLGAAHVRRLLSDR